MIMNLFFVFFFSGLIKLMESESMMISIMSLELMSSSIFLLSSEIFLIYNESYNLIILISFIVLESVLGLSIFVVNSRNNGNDLFKSINSLKYY